MDENRFKKAKDLFVKNKYSTYLIDKNEDSKKEWESYNVPFEIIKEWKKEEVDLKIDELYKHIHEFSKTIIGKLSNYNSSVSKYLGLFEFIIDEISEYDLKEYYPKIIDLINEMNKGYLFTIGMIGYWDMYDYGFLFFNRILQARQKMSDYRYTKSFDTPGDYLGLLSRLYYEKEYDLFFELLDILLEMNVNGGLINGWTTDFQLFELLLDYAKFIQDKNVYNKILDSMKVYKRRFSFYPQLFFEKTDEIRIEDKYEFERMKQIYYVKTIESCIFDENDIHANVKGFNGIFSFDSLKYHATHLEWFEEKCDKSNPTYTMMKEYYMGNIKGASTRPSYIFDMYELFEKYGVTKEAIEKWEKEKKGYVLNIVNNLDEYLNAPFEIIGNHNEQYEEFIMNNIKKKRMDIVKVCIHYVLFSRLDNQELLYDINDTLYKNKQDIASCYDSYMREMYKKNYSLNETNKEGFFTLLENLCNIIMKYDVSYVSDLINSASYEARIIKDDDFMIRLEKLIAKVLKGIKCHTVANDYSYLVIDK